MRHNIKDIGIIVLGVLAVVGLSGYINTLYLYSDLQVDYNELEYKYKLLQSEYYELEQNYLDLKFQYNVLEFNYEQLKFEYNLLSLRADYCCGEARDILYNLYYKLSGIEHFIAYNSVASRAYFESVSSGCLSGRVLDYQCVLFKYLPKYVESEDNEPDLYGYEDFLERGGDCDDFSLFAMALINRAVKEGYGVRLCVDVLCRNEVDVFLERAEMVCGSLLEDNTGHCVVRLVEDNKYVWFEPQTGIIYDSDPFGGEYDVIIDENDMYYYGVWLSRALELLSEVNSQLGVVR